MQGALPSQLIRELINKQNINNADINNIQPSSLDLTITDEVYKMKGVFLPKRGEKVRDIIKDGALYQTDLGKPLECGGIYLIKLKESISLPPNVYVYANNKSSSGRINLQVRLIADGVPYFDRIPRGTNSELWVVVSPKSFSVKLSAGNALNQIRFFGSNTTLSEEEYKELYSKTPLILNSNGEPIPMDQISFRHDITMSINLEQDLIGWKCSPSVGKLIDFNNINYYDPLEFFEPMRKPKDGQLILRSNEFYILSTVEHIKVPSDYAVEMAAYDPSKGEFRSHYAGFFDPGWGCEANGGGDGTPAVLEVLTQDNDFILRHGQPICKMIYERLAEAPDVVYGSDVAGSHYHGQKGPRLSKHFKN
ncbi:MAG: 2'-deoxycytidine 5'-triphosphate deaminase [bacterium]